MKSLFITLSILISVGFHSLAQGTKNAANYKVQWSINPFDRKVFIENNGQFDEVLSKKDKILYEAKTGKVFVYITNHGLIYQYTERPANKDADDKKADPDEDMAKPVTHYLYANWQGCNDSVSAIASEKLSSYYTYATKAGGIKAYGYRKVLCRNVYPGIDIEYVFPKNKQGIEYSLIVHKGANVALAKLKYSDAKKMSIDADGNIQIKTDWGTFTDHAPHVYYKEDSSTVASAYHLDGTTESFAIANTDAGKTMVVDPWVTNWTVNPNIYDTNAGVDAAYDEDYDYNGNVYACGSNDMEVVKMNSAGSILWTFVGGSIFKDFYKQGCFCVDKNTGSCYVMAGMASQVPPGPSVAKINNAGIFMQSITNTTLIEECWRCRWDKCNNQLIVAGGGGIGHNDVYRFDTNLANLNCSNPINTAHSGLYEDLAGIAINPAGTLCYMNSGFSSVLHYDYTLQMRLPALTTNYDVDNHFSFCEGGIVYTLLAGIDANGMNCMAASNNYLYIYNGDTLKQFNAANGSLAAWILLPGAAPFYWGGIDVDLCDNLYVGNLHTIYTYNSSLTQTGTIGPFADTIYDVKLGQRRIGGYDSLLYVCGDRYVSSIKITPPSGESFTKTRVIRCGCGSEATATLSICGNTADTNVSYQWSNGQTTQTATRLCRGNTYTVTASYGCAMQWQDTVIMPPGYDDPPSVTEISCTALGSVTVNAANGIPPYVYQWSTGATTSAISGLTAGTYSVIVSDQSACPDTINFTITGSLASVVTVSPIHDTVCAGTGVSLTANGTSTYSWQPTTGLSCSTCANTIATPGVTTTYTVNGYANGCSDSATTKIFVYSVPMAAFSYPYPLQNPTVQFSNNSTGNIINYLWSFGQDGDSNSSTAKNPVHTYSDSGTYCPTLVVVNNNGCEDSVSHCITLYPPLNLYIPDAFTPNGNHLNDLFGPEGTGLLSYTMYIYDRWGTRVYTTTESRAWDGTANGATVPEGIYIYQINALDHQNFSHSFVGKITVLR